MSQDDGSPQEKYDAIRSMAKKKLKIKNPVFFAREVQNVISHFGQYFEQTTIRRNLREEAIDLGEQGIRLAPYGLSRNLCIYRGSGVWKYLTDLRDRGDIHLDHAIRSIQDIPKEYFRHPRQDVLDSARPDHVEHDAGVYKRIPLRKKHSPSHRPSE